MQRQSSGVGLTRAPPSTAGTPSSHPRRRPAATARSQSTSVASSSSIMHPLLPVHECPDGPTFIQDWCNLYLSTLLGQTFLKKASVQDIEARQNGLHISRLEWRACLSPGQASLSVRRGANANAPAEAIGQASGEKETTGMMHRHHYLIAEVSRRVPAPIEYQPRPGNRPAFGGKSPPKSTENDSNSGKGGNIEKRHAISTNRKAFQVLGYIRMEGTCRPNLVFDYKGDGANPIPSRPTSTLASSNRPFDSNSSSSSSSFAEAPTPSHDPFNFGSSSSDFWSFNSDPDLDSVDANENTGLDVNIDMESTPVATRRRDFTHIGREAESDDVTSRSNHRPVTHFPASSSRPPPSPAQLTRRYRDEDSEEVDKRLDHHLSDLDFDIDLKPSPNLSSRAHSQVRRARQVGAASRRTSPLFISPFASRANSSTSTFTDHPSSSNSTRANSKSASRADLSTFSSLMGLSSGEGPSSDLTFEREIERDRVVAMHIERPPAGFGEEGGVYKNRQHPPPNYRNSAISTASGEGDRFVRRWPYPRDPHLGTQTDHKDDFDMLTLRDLALLADVIESSISSMSHDSPLCPDSLFGSRSPDSGLHHNGSTFSSTGTSCDSELGSDDHDRALTAPVDVAPCCCQFFRRLFDVLSAWSSPESGDQGVYRDGLKEGLIDLQRVVAALRAQLEQRKRQFKKELRLVSKLKSVNRRRNRTPSSKVASAVPKIEVSGAALARSDRPILATINRGSDSEVADNESGESDEDGGEDDNSSSSLAYSPEYAQEALNEAREATERFSGAVRDIEEFVRLSSSSEDEGRQV